MLAVLDHNHGLCIPSRTGSSSSLFVCIATAAHAYREPLDTKQGKPRRMKSRTILLAVDNGIVLFTVLFQLQHHSNE